VKGGFTLVEMLVVIAIVAVLATMVVGIAAHIDSKKE
jgi:prepilin-type N-terminal cleavage/methylation domain-containing protein